MRGTGDEVRLQVPEELMTMIKKGVWVAVKLRLVFNLSMPTFSDHSLSFPAFPLQICAKLILFPKCQLSADAG